MEIIKHRRQARGYGQKAPALAARTIMAFEIEREDGLVTMVTGSEHEMLDLALSILRGLHGWPGIGAQVAQAFSADTRIQPELAQALITYMDQEAKLGLADTLAAWAAKVRTEREAGAAERKTKT